MLWEYFKHEEWAKKVKRDNRELGRLFANVSSFQYTMEMRSRGVNKGVSLHWHVHTTNLILPPNESHLKEKRNKK
jgi:hypothetical protein